MWVIPHGRLDLKSMLSSNHASRRIPRAKSYSPEISSLDFCIWLERQTVLQSINDLFHDVRRNSVCACVHPERLMDSHLVDDGVRLRAVTNLLVYLVKVFLHVYPCDVGSSEGWSDFAGQHLEGCRLSGSVDSEETEAFLLRDSDTQLINGHKVSIEFRQILGDDWVRFDKFLYRSRLDTLSFLDHIRVLADLSISLSTYPVDNGPIHSIRCNLPH